MPDVVDPWKPGDVIITKLGRRLTVQDPPLTTRGKVRYLSATARTVQTAWWRDHLPEGYRREARPF